MTPWLLGLWVVLEAVGWRVAPVEPLEASWPRRAQVTLAAIEEGVPPSILNALHGVECNWQAPCPAGDGGKALGPFQIHEATAARAGCDYGDVQRLLPAARCGARIMVMNRDVCGDWWKALGAYNSGKCVDGVYADKVRRRM